MLVSPIHPGQRKRPVTSDTGTRSDSGVTVNHIQDDWVGGWVTKTKTVKLLEMRIKVSVLILLNLYIQKSTMLWLRSGLVTDELSAQTFLREEGPRPHAGIYPWPEEPLCRIRSTAREGRLAGEQYFWCLSSLGFFLCLCPIQVYNYIESGQSFGYLLSFLGPSSSPGISQKQFWKLEET